MEKATLAKAFAAQHGYITKTAFVAGVLRLCLQIGNGAEMCHGLSSGCVRLMAGNAATQVIPPDLPAGISALCCKRSRAAMSAEPMVARAWVAHGVGANSGRY